MNRADEDHLEVATEVTALDDDDDTHEIATEVVPEEDENGFTHLTNNDHDLQARICETSRGLRGRRQSRNSVLCYCDAITDLLDPIATGLPTFNGEPVKEVHPLQVIRRHCYEARLTPIALRHVAWALLLDLLPAKISEWSGLIESRRTKYELFKESFNYEERNSDSINPGINNPLSQDKESPWNKYFADKELKNEIIRDVVRTSANHSLFQENTSVREVMTAILFVYAKKYPSLAYKQGMHEILAILLQVQYDCCKVFQDLCDKDENSTISSDLLDTLTCLNDIKYLEHDTYFLFEKFMGKMWDWYYVSEEAASAMRKKFNKDRKPFEANSSDYGLCSAAKRLQNLWDNILQVHDPQLYHHLQEMFILPTTFGTNWTKLLFSRQVADYLLLWDAIVASGFTLIDYIVVAMVVAIRNLLIEGDSNKCNCLLVTKYPPSIDIRYILSKSLHIQAPQDYPQPSKSPFKLGISYLQDLSAKTLKLQRQPRPMNQRSGAEDTKSKNKKLFAFSSTNESKKLLSSSVPTGRKMINLSSGAEEIDPETLSTFGMLEGESSWSLLQAEMVKWKDQLETGLRVLTSKVRNEPLGQETGVREALEQIGAVVNSMNRVTTSWSNGEQNGESKSENDK